MDSLLIAGASRGIGLAMAEHFSASVATLYCVSRSEAPFGQWISADLATQTGIDRVIAQLSDKPLDALIFAGGTWETGAFTEAYDFAQGPTDDIDRVIAVNLLAPIKLVQGLLPSFRRSSLPRILFVGSLSGLENAASREVANSASKFGLRGAAQALRLELAGFGIQVTVINPGNLATPEVLGDIAQGRFPPQDAIPLTDLLAATDFALSLSASAVATEINLAQAKQP